MRMTGECRIEAPREEVWAALNDPEVLKRCIPGCEELEKTSEREFTAKVNVKIGPVSAKFAGAVSLSDLNPPESYRISGEGKGGAAGFAKGGATVTLAADGGGTLLAYEVDAQVGGKLAQIGQRLIAGTARKLADEFFGCLVEALAAPVAEVAAPAKAAAALAQAAPSDTDVGAGARIGVWVAGTILAVLILLAIFGLG